MGLYNDFGEGTPGSLHKGGVRQTVNSRVGTRKRLLNGTYVARYRYLDTVASQYGCFDGSRKIKIGDYLVLDLEPSSNYMNNIAFS